MVVAKILIPEEDGEVNEYALGMFMVQVRDENTHKWIKGITSGDMGPKFGYSSKDNGWMHFDQVRVKRDNMLSNVTAIDDDGCFELRGNPKQVYMTMTRTRTFIINCTPQFSLMGLLLVIRYSCIRRQFQNITAKPNEETTLMDYQVQ